MKIAPAIKCIVLATPFAAAANLVALQPASARDCVLERFNKPCTPCGPLQNLADQIQE